MKSILKIVGGITVLFLIAAYVINSDVSYPHILDNYSIATLIFTIIVFGGTLLCALISVVRTLFVKPKTDMSQKPIRFILVRTVIALGMGALGLVLFNAYLKPSEYLEGIYTRACINSPSSYACRAFYRHGPINTTTNWCEGYFGAAYNLSKDGTQEVNARDIAIGAKDAGYVIPNVSEVISEIKETNGIAVYDGTVNTAGLLCIDPEKGGYTPNP